MKDLLIDVLNGALKNHFDYVPLDATIKVADQLLAEGVIVPPCKIGDTAYVLMKTDRPEYEYKKGVNQIVVRHIRIHSDGIFVSDFWGFMDWKWGERAFLSQEEAEQKAKEG